MVKWASFLEVSTSGYYAWQQERESRQARDNVYAGQVQRVFDQSGGTYGADRVTGQLRKDGFSASFKKVKRIMNEHGLFSVHLRYQRSLTDSRGSRDEDCPNLLRGVTELKPYRALSSDITYIHMKKELVMETIRAAANS